MDILVTSKNGDRKIMESMRIMSRLSLRIRKWNQLSQFRWTSTKVIPIENASTWTLVLLYCAIKCQILQWVGIFVHSIPSSPTASQFLHYFYLIKCMQRKCIFPVLWQNPIKHQTDTDQMYSADSTGSPHVESPTALSQPLLNNFLSNFIIEALLSVISVFFFFFFLYKPPSPLQAI